MPCGMPHSYPNMYSIPQWIDTAIPNMRPDYVNRLAELPMELLEMIIGMTVPKSIEYKYRPVLESLDAGWPWQMINPPTLSKWSGLTHNWTDDPITRERYPRYYWS